MSHVPSPEARTPRRWACPCLGAAALLAVATLAGTPVAASPQETPSSSGRARSERSGSEWYARGMELHESGRWDEAIPAFRQAIEAGYRVDAATYNIACGHARKGEKDLAFEWLGQAMEAGFNLAAYLDDEDLASLKTDPRWTDLKAKARTVRAGKDRQRVEKAVKRFDSLMSASRKDGRDLFENGRELLRVAEYDRAARAFVAAAETGTREGTSHFNAACARALAGRKDEAFALLRRALDTGFDDPDQLREDEDLDGLRSDPRFAELVRDAEALSLEGFPSWGARLLLSERVAEAKEAAARFEAYLKKNPSSGRAYSNLGVVHLAAENDREAARAFTRALELGYRKATTAYNLACAHARLGEKDAAFARLDEAIAAGYRDPDHMEKDDDLFSLRRDPRFKAAVEKARRNE